jgi:hypothetical protein
VREKKNYEVSVNPDADPIPFTITVLNVASGETVRTEEFQAVAPANAGGGPLLTLGRLTQRVNGKETADINAISEFFQRVLLADSAQRFQALLDDRTVGVPLDVLGEIMNDLIEEYTGYPTQPPSSSSTGRSTTGVSSTAPALSTPA